MGLSYNVCSPSPPNFYKVSIVTIFVWSVIKASCFTMYLVMP